MKTFLFSTILVFHQAISIFSQPIAPITFLEKAPVVDGTAEEIIWGNLPALDAFTAALPVFGKPAQSPTTVKIGYASQGIFVFADCKGTSIRNDGSDRDQIGTADYFSVGFDTWDDDQNAFVFTVTAGGQKIDERMSSTGSEIFYNAPWKTRTQISADGWSVEIFIPWKSLRFSTQIEQNWGIQFTRYDRSSGELSTWSPQDPLIEDKVWQYGKLEGLRDIHRKDRFGLSILSNVTNTDIESKITGYGTEIRTDSLQWYDYVTGFDARYGPTSATTIDIMVNPSLNRTIPGGLLYENPLIINRLFPERQGHIEESGIFNKSQPLAIKDGINAADFEYLYASIPTATFRFQEDRTFGQMAITSRLPNKIGISVFNTLSNELDVTLFNTLTGRREKIDTYKIPVSNQIAIEKLYRNNSWVQIGNVHKFIGENRHYNLASTAGQWRDKTNHYEVAGKLLMETIGAKNTFSGNFSFEKINSNWNWGGQYFSPGTFYAQDLPPFFYEELPQEHAVNAHIIHRSFSHPFRNWLNYETGFFGSWLHNSKEEEIANLKIGWQANMLSKNFNRLTVSTTFQAISRKEYLEFVNRILERRPPSAMEMGASWSTDERKRLVFVPFGYIKKSLATSEDYFSGGVTLKYTPWQYLKFEANIWQVFETSYRLPNYSVDPSFALETGNSNTVVAGGKILFTPSRKLFLGADFQYNIQQRTKRKVYVIDQDGALQDAFGEIENSESSHFLLPGFFMGWYISPVRQISCSYTSTISYDKQIYLTAPPIPVSVQSKVRAFTLRLLFNFNR